MAESESIRPQKLINYRSLDREAKNFERNVMSVVGQSHSTEISCRDYCHTDAFRKLICDVLSCRNSSYDAVLILQLVAVNGTGKSIHLVKVCGLTNLDVKFVPADDGYPNLQATEGVCYGALFHLKIGSSRL